MKVKVILLLKVKVNFDVFYVKGKFRWWSLRSNLMEFFVVKVNCDDKCEVDGEGQTCVLTLKVKVGF